jgi:glyoxylase-like metal-dependent hydrolase (beta-lactamase superfamily II)
VTRHLFLVIKPPEQNMNIHAIQTGTVAVKQSQPDGGDRSRRSLLRVMADSRWTEPLPIYAWLIEHPEGLIVVDTGETARVSEAGYFPRWHPYFRLGLREWVGPEQEIGPQLQALGFSPDDVRWVVLTHFHTDHAGGLGHFPKSEFLATRSDYASSRGLRGSVRGFLPQRWPKAFAPTLIEHQDGPFESFAQSTALTRAGDVHLIPTPGHTVGHMSVVLEEGDRVIVFAGDASYTEQNMVDGVPDGVSASMQAARDSLSRLRRLAGARPTVYLPTHDPGSGARLAARQAVGAS